MTASAAPSVWPTLSAPASEPQPFEHAEILQAAFEHAGGGVTLPPGLVLTSPLLVTLLAVRVPDGPHGPFTFAQVRVSCRSGARARALVVDSVVDASDVTAAALADGWGIGARRGEVRLRRGYDAVTATCDRFEVTLLDPAPIGVHDVQYVAGLHPVQLTTGEHRLAQVELDVEPTRLERSRPALRRFESAPGVADAVLGSGPDRDPARDVDPERGRHGLHPRHPVAGTIAVGRLTLPRMRFVLDPDRPPHEGTTVLA